ncbi:predicted protein [Naegleria gruberi]|uniref:Predicted protein n=1 Tax=Naegleria gruberi TaxID=5762 RepID=D2V0H2_NAEGR|nr:uncharacterized protein NAEGRDRAFT_62294 [Naegleria gruberi]EFC49522.1 predicted protein [Naegleria gruberi]|eukprot:XP_002682266.1 predicted protein [Naegleria gruberi strain NEG-M]
MSGLKFPRQSEESFATSSSRKSSSDESSSEVESEMEKQPEKLIEKPVEKPIEKPPTPIVQENYVSLFQNTEALNRVFAKSKEVSQIPDFWFYTPTFIPMTQWEQPNTSKFNCPNYGTLDTLSFNTLTSSYNSIRQNCPLVVLEKKKFCNPVPFIDSFNKYYGEKYKTMLAENMRQEVRQREFEVDKVLNYLKHKREKEGSRTSNNEGKHKSKTSKAFSLVTHGKPSSDTSKKAKIKVDPKKKLKPKAKPEVEKKQPTLFETVKPSSKSEKKPFDVEQIPTSDKLKSSSDLNNAPAITSRSSSKRSISRADSPITTTNSRPVSRTGQLNDAPKRETPDPRVNKSRSLTSSPVFQFEPSYVMDVKKPVDVKISESRTAIISLLADSSNTDFVKTMNHLGPLLEETVQKKEEELENISALYALMKSMEKKNVEQYRSICQAILSNNIFLDYLKATITNISLNFPEVFQFIMKIVRKLCEYSFQILGQSSVTGIHHLLKFIKISVINNRLQELGFSDCIIEKMDALNDHLKQLQDDSSPVQPNENSSSPDHVPEKAIYNIMRDMFHSVTCISFCSTEVRTKLLMNTPFFGITSSIFKMKRAPILKTNVLLCLEKIILSGTRCNDNEEYHDDSTTSILLDMGLMSLIIADYNSLTIKVRKSSNQKKKKQAISLKQALYQLIRALSFHEKAREEMYKTGFFHNLLSVMKELGANGEEFVEEDVNTLKGLILEAISNFVPSSSIHRDSLILKYIFDTVVEMFISVPVTATTNLLLETRTLHILSQLSDYTRTHQIIYEARVVEHAFNLLQRDLNQQQVPPDQGAFVFSMTSSTFLSMLLMSNLSKYKEGQRHIYDNGLNPIIRLLKLSSSISEYKSKLEAAKTEMNIIFTPFAMSFDEYELLPKVISRTLANISTLPESHFTFFKEIFLDSLASMILCMNGERTVIWNCLCTLSNLCEADTMLQRKLISKSAIRDCLLKYLLENDHKLQSRSIRCISKLARNESILTQIHDTFKISNIVRAMETNSMDECKLDGLRILFHFSQFEQFHPSFLKSGAIEFMVKITHSSVESIVVESLKNLLNLIFANDKSIKDTLIQAGTVDRLWELKKCEKSSEKVRRLCLSALKAM